MPVTLEFFRNGVRLHHTGTIHDSDLIQVQQDIYAHEYPDKLQFQIMDLVAVTDFLVNGDIMRELGLQDLKYAQNVHPQHMIVIAPSEGRVESILWEAWTKDPQPSDPSIVTTIVSTEAEAQVWLRKHGIEPRKE